MQQKKQLLYSLREPDSWWNLDKEFEAMLIRKRVNNYLLWTPEDKASVSLQYFSHLFAKLEGALLGVKVFHSTVERKLKIPYRQHICFFVHT